MSFRLPMLLVAGLAACGGAARSTPTAAPRRAPVAHADRRPAPPPPERQHAEPASPSAATPAPTAPSPAPTAPSPALAVTMATVDPAGATANEKIAGRVLVWVDAHFQLAPRSPSFQLATLPGPRKDHLGEAVPMRFVSVKGDLIEVETPKLDDLGNDETDCAWFDLRPPWELDTVRLFVHRADLAPVTTRHHVVTFPDGTSITVEPGAPVIPLADGRQQLAIDKLTVAAALPPEVIGRSYPTLAAERDWKPNWVLGADAVTLGPDRYAMPKGVFPFMADQVEPRGDHTLFPIEGRCAKLVVAAPASAVRAYVDHPGGMLGGIGMGGMMGAERWTLPAGTALTAHGRVIAHVRHPIDVAKPARGAKQVCVDRVLVISSNKLDRPGLAAIEDGGKLRLCAPARVVKHEKGMGLGHFSGGFGKGSGKLGGARHGKKPAK